MTHLSWQSLVEVEPNLTLIAARANGGGDWRCWSNIKSDLSQLVGWDARNPELRSCEAYELAYAEVLRIFEDANDGWM
jgi:hypothetical protein